MGTSLLWWRSLSGRGDSHRFSTSDPLSSYNPGDRAANMWTSVDQGRRNALFRNFSGTVRDKPEKQFIQRVIFQQGAPPKMTHLQIAYIMIAVSYLYAVVAMYSSH